MKKLVLLAATLLATSAFAQSNVTIYGVLDLGFAHSTADRTDNVDTKNGVVSNLWSTSNVGFKGTEDLGSGITAGFTLEYGLSPNTSSGVGAGNTSREGTLFLSSKELGTIKVGRQSTPGDILTGKYTSMDGTSFDPTSTLQGLTMGARANNTIAYISPSFSGLTVGGAYASDTTLNANVAYGNGTPQERVVALFADYDMGPVSVGYVFHRVNDLAAVAGSDNREHFVGAKWTVTPDLFVAGGYTVDQNTDHSVRDNRIYNVGVSYKVMPRVTVATGYSRLNDKTAANGDATAYGIQASYTLSKRTMAYAGYQHVSNDNGATFVALGTTNGVTPTALGGSDSTGYGVGLRHAF